MAIMVGTSWVLAIMMPIMIMFILGINIAGMEMIMTVMMMIAMTPWDSNIDNDSISKRTTETILRYPRGR